MRRRIKQSGSVILEMTFVGIPLIFMLISIFEVSRGMWIYHTLSFGAREATRFVIVHGVNCQTSPSTCGITVGPTGAGSSTCGFAVLDLATNIACSAPGLVPNDITVTFSSGSDYFKCKLSDMQGGSCPGTSASSSGFLGKTDWADWFTWLQGGGTGSPPTGGTTCASTKYIPTCGGNSPGFPIVISLSYPFNSAISMFWPGATSQQFGAAVLGATSADVMQF